METIKLEYIGKEPETVVGGLRVRRYNKGDRIEVDERKANAMLRNPKKWKLIKEKSKKQEGEE